MSEMKGRTCVVTGATSGIGREAARALATMGGDVILVARDEAKAEATKDELARTIPGARVDWVQCDFASLASIRSAAETLRSKREQIHVLLNNAGAIHTSRQTSADGFELTFAVNHLGYFLLTHLLRAPIEAAGTPARKARIVSVASGLHPRGKLVWDDLMSTRSYASFDVYATSKLCNVMFTYELARRLGGTNVSANCLHPGVIGSGFGHNDTGLLKLGVSLVRPFLWTTEKGARTSITLASSPSVEGVTGKYFDQHGRQSRSSRASYDVDAQTKLWAISETLCGLR